MRAVNQFTIHSLNDVVTQTTAPSNPYTGQLWVDTSKTPPITKIYTGSEWKEQNGTDDIKSNVATITTKQASFETNLNGLSSSVLTLTTRVGESESKLQDLDNTLDTAVSDISSLQQTASNISAEVSNKVDTTYGSSSSTFGWSLKSDGFYIYSNASTVVKITSSGLEVDGKITSTNGTIGGFTINSSNLHTGSKTSYSSATSGVYIGTNGIGLGAGKFYVTSAGYLYSVSGKIGSFTINSSSLYSGTWGSDNSIMLCNGTSTSKAIGGSASISGWTITSGSKFGVTKTGVVYASDVHLSGAITATSGTFNNCTINSNCSMHLEGSETVKFFSDTPTITYSMDISGTGIYSDITFSGNSRTSKSIIKPMGMIVVPQDFDDYANDGLLFGICNKQTFDVDSLQTGISIYYGKGVTVGGDKFLVKLCNHEIINASVQDFSFSVAWGNEAYGNRVYGPVYLYNVLSFSETLNEMKLVTSGTSSYVDILGDYRFGNKVYFGTMTGGYLGNTSQNSTYYPYLSGNWYASTMNFGNYNGYRIRIDSDQITFYYGTTQLGEFESYSGGYVDLQGTFKTNGSNWISSSDIRVKNSIEFYDDRYDVLFDNLKPRRYKYNEGKSGRYHTGFIVQETLEAMNKAEVDRTEFACVCAFGDVEKEDTFWGLRYEELIPLNTWEIQKLKIRVIELENKIKQLEEQNEIN